jgi:hypothetical protein
MICESDKCARYVCVGDVHKSDMCVTEVLESNSVCVSDVCGRRCASDVRRVRDMRTKCVFSQTRARVRDMRQRCVVCVRERERASARVRVRESASESESERARERARERELSVCGRACCVCVWCVWCVCVCVCAYVCVCVCVCVCVVCVYGIYVLYLSIYLSIYSLSNI